MPANPSESLDVVENARMNRALDALIQENQAQEGPTPEQR
jgi:hypothetical protein